MSFVVEIRTISDNGTQSLIVTLTQWQSAFQIWEPSERPRWISAASVSALQRTQMARGTVGWLSPNWPGAAATATTTKQPFHNWTTAGNYRLRALVAMAIWHVCMVV